MADKNQDGIDDSSGVVGKVVAGKYDRLNIEDGVDASRMVVNLMPGGQVIDPALAALQGDLSASREYKQLSHKFGDLRTEAYHSTGIKRKLSEFHNRWKNRAGEAAVSGTGAIAGAWIGSALIPIPIVGTLGGTIAGGALGNLLYNKVSPYNDQDAVTLVSQIADAQAQGEQIPPEVVFAALAANLPDKIGKKMDSTLKERIGTRQFNQAVAMGKSDDLRKMMFEFDDVIRGRTQMPLDEKDSGKTVAEQYAEQINNGTMRASALLKDIPHADGAPNIGYPENVSYQPVRQVKVPHIQDIAESMTSMGVAITKDGDGNVRLLPQSHHSIQKV